jgi:hypothetical protein
VTLIFFGEMSDYLEATSDWFTWFTLPYASQCPPEDDLQDAITSKANIPTSVKVNNFFIPVSFLNINKVFSVTKI